MSLVVSLFFVVGFARFAFGLFCRKKASFRLGDIKIRQIRVFDILTLRVCLMCRFPISLRPGRLNVIRPIVIGGYHVLFGWYLTISLITSLPLLLIIAHIGVISVRVYIVLGNFFENQEFSVLFNVPYNLYFVFKIFSLLLTACKRVVIS
jgi:hypothetical protein